MIDVKESIRKKVLEDNYGKNDPIELFHPSSAGFCERQIFLGKLGVKTFPEDVRGAMQIGTVIHDWVQGFEEVKENFHIEQFHVLEIPKSKAYFQGKIDLKDKKTDYVIDLKSIKALYFVSEEPMKSHVAQVNVYMAMANVKESELLYIQKHNLETLRHKVKFDEELLKATFDKIKRVYQALLDFDNGNNMRIPFEKCGCYACDHERLDQEFKARLENVNN